jgi:hypothetical protein
MDAVLTDRKIEQEVVESELIKNLLLSGSTLEYRSIITSVFINTLNTDLSSDYRDRVCNVYLGLMELLNSIDERP